jgi:DNA-binding winged helix-turn-helix (wHTH) protein
MRRDKTWNTPLNSDRFLATSFEVQRRARGLPMHITGCGPDANHAVFSEPRPVRDGDSVDPQTIVDKLTRIEALLQRQIEMRGTILRVGSLELDLVERSARRAKRIIDLLPREYRLLKYMMQHSGELLARSRLLEEVWHYKFTPVTNLVDVQMGRLRHKVDGPNEVPMIHSVRGSGFVLRADS